MKFFWIFCMLLVLLFLQTSLISVPLTLGGVLLFCVLYREYWIFVVAFIMGIFVDLLSFQAIGSTSLFFVVMLGGIFLYERKFEMQSIPFITIFTLVSAISYGFLFHQQQAFLAAFLVTIFVGGIFFILAHLNNFSFHRSLEI